MKKNTIIFWTSTGIFSLMMFFSAYSYFTNPEIATGFKQMGFPDFFRIELAYAKLIGALALIIPVVPLRVKEWAYAGFGINLISATITHLALGHPTANAVTPLVLLAILVVSNIYLHKIKTQVA